jgi:TnpA family transposase
MFGVRQYLCRDVEEYRRRILKVENVILKAIGLGTFNCFGNETIPVSESAD